MLYWNAFLDMYNGRNLYHFLWGDTSEDLHLFYWWLQIRLWGHFRKSFHSRDIPSRLEPSKHRCFRTLPHFALVHIFGPQLANSQVIFHSDNEAVVFILNNKTSKDTMIMKLLRPLVLVLTKQNIIFRSVHIPGVKNIVCDHLSRYQADASFLRHHALDASPTPVPTTICPANWKP